MLTERDAQGASPGANDDARPDAGAAAPSSPATTPDGQATAPRQLNLDDPDDAELAAALAAEAAEAQGNAGGETQPPATQPPPTTPPAAATPQQPTADGPKPPPIMVPKARLDEMVARARAAEQRLLMAQGAIQVLSGQAGRTGAAPNGQQGSEGAPAPAAVTPPQQTPQQQIEALRADMIAAAEKHDAGEITLAEFKRLEATIDDQIAALREQAVLAKVPQPQAPEPGVADQAIRQQHLSALYERHPYAHGLTSAQAQALAQRAAVDLALEGQPVGTGPLEDMRLRARVAALSDEWGPKWGIQPSRPVTASPPQNQPPANGRAAGLSPQAQARANKLALAASLPPDTSSLGSGASGGDGITEAAIEMMSDEEITALPASVRARFLPTGA